MREGSVEEGPCCFQESFSNRVEEGTFGRIGGSGDSWLARGLATLYFIIGPVAGATEGNGGAAKKKKKKKIGRK